LFSRKPPGRSGIVEHFADRVLGSFQDEFFQILDRYCYRDGIVDPARLDELDRAYWYLDEIAQGDVDAFVATKLEWKAFDGTPVYLVELGGFMLAFAVAEDSRLVTPVIVALACGLRENADLNAFWGEVVLPRLQAIL
jgi:hypothetical protein